MSSFGTSPTYFHSFIVEGLPAADLISFATSIKMDQAVRGASHCVVSTYQSADGIDKLEAKNVFDDLASRDAYISSLSPPNQEALAGMGVRLTTHVGSVVSNTLTAPTQQHVPSVPAPSSGGGVQPNKASWPELMNTPSAQAMAVISEQRPDVKAMLVPQGAMVTMDMRMDRVRVFHDVSTGMVTSTPKIG